MLTSINIAKLIYVLVVVSALLLGFFDSLPDSDTYLGIVERIQANGSQPDIDFVFNQQVLLLSGEGLDSEEILGSIRLFNLLLVLLAMHFFFPVNGGKLIPFVVIAAFYGLLISLVLLRAAPAYLFVFFALSLFSMRRFLIGVLCCLGAIFFHVSAGLAALPLLLAVINNYLKIDFSQSWRLVSIVFLSSFLVFIFNAVGFDFLGQLGGAFDFGKYGAYFADEKDSLGVLHLIYFVFVVAASFAFYRNRSAYNTIESNYILMSLVIFLSFSSSPVLVFRQSIFWIPLVLYRMDSWRYFSPRIVKMVVLSGAVFVFSINLLALVK
ncbi:EpsG family protein [Fluviibacter phosphoraccumulans]|uniref:EpsG family protein n=1 Tax=Fluviibacter phosphoraccumulans TaxID=1751046 RepID=UPI0010B41827|nr:EpsG family protein [Fluviibacter phosphoraccumulans]